jgi:hypothetical protein
MERYLNRVWQAEVIEEECILISKKINKKAPWVNQEAYNIILENYLPTSKTDS